MAEQQAPGMKPGFNPAPPAPPAPPSKSKSKAPWIIGGALVISSLFYGVGVAANADTTAAPVLPSPTSSSFSDQGTPVFTDDELGVDEPVACLDKQAAKVAGKGAIGALNEMADYADTYNVKGMGRALRETADYTRDMAEAADGDPAVSNPLYRAATLYDEAGSLLGGSIYTMDLADARESGRKMAQANELLKDARRALDRSVIVSC